MTDTSPGPGWWLASDGRWYPPHLHPDQSAPRAGATVDDARPGGDATEPHDHAANGSGDHGSGEATAAAFAAPQYVPPREPIDWEKVAAERAARRKAGESQRKRRIAGAVLVSLGALALLAAFARNRSGDDRSGGTASPATTTTAAPTTTTETAATTTAPATSLPEGAVSVFSLQPGTCVDNADLSTGLVTTVTEVPCDQPHSHEVYHKVTYTPPDGAYDADRISQFAGEQCSESFAAYVGVPYDRSQYYFLNFAPTQESWTQRGDREVVCLLFLLGSELTGSAKGTAQ